MIRTGEQYRDSIREGREIYIDGERVEDVTVHPSFKPLVDIRARIYDMQHEAAHLDVMTVVQDGEVNAIGNALPFEQEDWWAKRRATDHVMNEIGGVVTRVGDETVGEMWSLYDGQDVLNEVDPKFSANIENHIQHVLAEDPFHVSANTDPKGDRSKAPQDQDPDMLLHLGPMPALSCAAPNSRRQPLTPIRPSPSRLSQIGAMSSSPIMRSVLSVI